MGYCLLIKSSFIFFIACSYIILSLQGYRVITLHQEVVWNPWASSGGSRCNPTGIYFWRTRWFKSPSYNAVSCRSQWQGIPERSWGNVQINNKKMRERERERERGEREREERVRRLTMNPKYFYLFKNEYQVFFIWTSNLHMYIFQLLNNLPYNFLSNMINYYHMFYYT